MTPSWLPQTDLFSGAFASLEPGMAGPAPLSEDVHALAESLPQAVRLGTSSWSFPGWRGLVYDREAPAAALARKGLTPYARHPLLRTVGVDRTYYAPLEAERFQEYAAQVPEDFRFVVKADRALTFPTLGTVRSPTAQVAAAPRINPDFLNPERARRTVVEPVVRGLGTRLGLLLFQFPPVLPRAVGGAEGFARRLGVFLGSLPAGPRYAVEVRTPELLGPALARTLGAAGASLAYAVHPALPPLDEQVRLIPPAPESPLLIRWMLGHGQRYEEARERYHPFNQIVDPDPVSRTVIADLCRSATQRSQPTFVIVNNKAEGSSPASVLALARVLAESVQ